MQLDAPHILKDGLHQPDSDFCLLHEIVFSILHLQADRGFSKGMGRNNHRVLTEPAPAGRERLSSTWYHIVISVTQGSDTHDSRLLSSIQLQAAILHTLPCFHRKVY